jgi:hypothetical protein
MDLVLLLVAIFICLGGVYQWLARRDLNNQRSAVREALERRQRIIADRRRLLSEIGDPTGKTLHEIIEKVGLPNSYSNIGRGLLVQWIQPGSHLSLLFEYRGSKPKAGAPVNISQHESDFVCTRITHQFSGGM